MDADDQARTHEPHALIEGTRLRVELSMAAVRESQKLLAQWRQGLDEYRVVKAQFRVLLERWRTLGE